MTAAYFLYISGTINYNLPDPPPPVKGSRDLTVSLWGLERNLLLALLLARPQAVSFPVIQSIRATRTHNVHAYTWTSEKL
jgi:hypothetical protein